MSGAHTASRAIGFLAAISALGAVGCGGGIPLLHPAKALPRGEMRVMGGLSANAVIGSAANDLASARAQATAQNGNEPGVAGTNPTYAKGALVEAALAPGVAPVVGARVGIGYGAEGGIAYTGRGGRVDMRATYDRGAVTYSAGLGVSAAFYGTQQGETLPDVVLSQLHGYGADIPLLVGWQSAGGIYQVWGGVRAGFEHDTIENVVSEPGSAIGAEPIRLTGTKYYGGGVAGLAVGFRHVHVALELDASYVDVDGAYNGTHATLQGVALTPASALWWDF